MKAKLLNMFKDDFDHHFPKSLMTTSSLNMPPQRMNFKRIKHVQEKNKLLTVCMRFLATLNT